MCLQACFSRNCDILSAPSRSYHVCRRHRRVMPCVVNTACESLHLPTSSSPTELQTRDQHPSSIDHITHGTHNETTNWYSSGRQASLTHNPQHIRLHWLSGTVAQNMPLQIATGGSNSQADDSLTRALPHTAISQLTAHSRTEQLPDSRGHNDTTINHR